MGKLYVRITYVPPFLRVHVRLFRANVRKRDGVCDSEPWAKAVCKAWWPPPESFGASSGWGPRKKAL